MFQGIPGPDPIVRGSVSDPYSFFPDPDPEVEAGHRYGFWIRIRIPNTDRDPLARLNTDPIFLTFYL
jgi:hypothetical protein